MKLFFSMQPNMGSVKIIVYIDVYGEGNEIENEVNQEYLPDDFSDAVNFADFANLTAKLAVKETKH